MTKTTPATILVLNGPNLNLLGTREPETYGTASLSDIEEMVKAHAETLGCTVIFRQTNQEGTLVDWIQEGGKSADGIILNAAAYTHTSVALHDAIAAIETPVVEVHISNVFAREAYRHHSYVSDVAAGVICGFGPHGYILALDAVMGMLHGQP